MSKYLFFFVAGNDWQQMWIYTWDCGALAQGGRIRMVKNFGNEKLQMFIASHGAILPYIKAIILGTDEINFLISSISYYVGRLSYPYPTRRVKTFNQQILTFQIINKLRYELSRRDWNLRKRSPWEDRNYWLVHQKKETETSKGGNHT